MIVFHLRLAWRSLWRTPGFTGVMLLALALGVASWYVPHQVFNLLDAEALPGRTDLRHVALLRTPPHLRAPRLMADAASLLLTVRDAAGVLGSGATRRETVTFSASALVTVDGAARRVRARYATRDLFPMFEIPFASGGAWSPASDARGLAGDAPAREVVVGARLAEQLFGGGDAVGRRVRVNGHDALVTGVVAHAHERVARLYDLRSLDELPEDVYLPVAAAAAARAVPDFVHTERFDGDLTGLLAGESGFLQMWIELADPAHEAAFVAHVRAHLSREAARPRHVPVTGVRLRDPHAWSTEIMRVEGTVRLWPPLAMLALAASLLNLVRLLLAKFAGRTQDLGLLRAFGARRRSLVGQLLLEAALVGFLGGLLGLGLGVAMMPAAKGALLTPYPIQALTARDAALAFAVSIGAALLAAAYPAWRLGRGTPAVQLRRQ